MQKIILLIGGIALLAGGGVFLFFMGSGPVIIEITRGGVEAMQEDGAVMPLSEVGATSTHSLATSTAGSPSGSADIDKQQKLPNPPSVVKAVYATSWSAGSEKKMDYLMRLIDETELNGIVIDIKDYSGFVAYRTGLAATRDAGAEGDLRIVYPNKLIKRLHDKNIYVIGRISVFQDTVLAKAHPEWALKNASSGELWADRKGLAWLDPSLREVWDYNIAIAEDAFSRGFDEINFDYIRFASDGNLDVIGYPGWNEVTPRATVIKNFFRYLRERLPNAILSADLFGLVTVNNDDLGIGQVIENAYEYFDFVSPMVYPSHYASGFLGFKNPASFPYEVVRYSMDNGLAKLVKYTRGPSHSTSTPSTSTVPVAKVIPTSKLRPWLQDFDLGATYDAAMVQKEIQAVYDAAAASAAENVFSGWLLWDPSNIYTKDALQASQ